MSRERMAGRGSFRHSFPPSQRAGGSCTVSRSQREERKFVLLPAPGRRHLIRKGQTPKSKRAKQVPGQNCDVFAKPWTPVPVAPWKAVTSWWLFFFGTRLYSKRNMQFFKKNDVNSNFKTILHCHKIIIYWITWQQTFERELPCQHDASLFLAINDHFKKAG